MKYVCQIENTKIVLWNNDKPKHTKMFHMQEAHACIRQECIYNRYGLAREQTVDLLFLRYVASWILKVEKPFVETLSMKINEQEWFYEETFYTTMQY